MTELRRSDDAPARAAQGHDALLRAVEARLRAGPEAGDGFEELILSLVRLGLENARRVTALRAQFHTFVAAVSAALDARDPCKLDHSVNVANYAAGIGCYLELDEQELETLRLAGLLHDVGKLAVPERILSKPDRLTALETQQLQVHAQYTRRILERVAWTEGLESLPALASAHHERLDGSGYPAGLHERDLPLPARILAVADVFCALTQDRSYRPGMNVDEALLILDSMIPGSLDAQCVAALRRFLGQPPEPPSRVAAA